MKVRGLQRGLYRLAGRHHRQKLYDHPEVQRCHEALDRFRELNQTYGVPVREAAALLGVSLSTLYRWRACYQARGRRGLRPRSRRPRRGLRKRWAPELTRRLIQLRKQHLGWGKRKLTVLLRREGYAVSGILNFVLKEEAKGGSVEARGVDTTKAMVKMAVSWNFGLPLTEDGFLNVSSEINKANPTSRSVQRSDAQALIDAGNMHVRTPAAQVWGAPEIEDNYKLFANAGVGLGDSHEAYAFWQLRRAYH